MKSLMANAIVGISTVSIVVALILVHELLAAIAGADGRFVVARRRLAIATTVFAVLLAAVIAGRFYYLRT